MRNGARKKGCFMKELFEEFKAFIAQGNVMDMAVGVIVGGAFSSIVNSLIDDIINPLIALFGGVGEDGTIAGLTFLGINFGAFLGAIINFLIIAAVVFALVKGVNAIKSVAGLEKEEEEPAPAPTCPHCLEEIKEGATRCPHCGGEIA